MRWEEFARAAPDLAALGAERFERTGLSLVGTLRIDGTPRISPVEPTIAGSDLLLGMMWQSRKALDLLRDPRLVVHSVVSDREGTEGDFKLYGRVLDVPEPERRNKYADAVEARIDWRPTEPYHLFAVDIESAGFVIFGKEGYALSWNPNDGLRRFDAPG
jgi:hypothetical protein